MTKKEEAAALYKGKTFFIKRPDGTLDGPRNDILYVSGWNESEYTFIQVVDSKPVQAFKEDEILVIQE